VCAHVDLKLCCAGDDVVGLAAVDAGAGHDGDVGGGDQAADDALEPDDHVRRDEDGVDAELGEAGMAAFADDGDFERVGGCHERAGCDGHVSCAIAVDVWPRMMSGMGTLS